jgi:hypothetical protein
MVHLLSWSTSTPIISVITLIKKDVIGMKLSLKYVIGIFADLLKL